VRRNLRSRALLFRGGGRPEQHGVHGLHVLILLVLVLFRSIRGLEHLVSLKTWARTDVCCWWAGRGVILTRECASSLLARLACLCVVRLLCACACVRVCARVCARFHLVSCQPAAHVLRDARHVDRERHHEILERAKLRQLPDLALRTAHPALLDRWRAPRRGAEHRVAGAHDRGQNTAVSEVMVERSGKRRGRFFRFPTNQIPGKKCVPKWESVSATLHDGESRCRMVVGGPRQGGVRRAGRQRAPQGEACLHPVRRGAATPPRARGAAAARRPRDLPLREWGSD